ncbi:MAG: hypothetical protein KGS09_17095 [Nitrospirae bacterium]|nr:hypothetical protein [Nitrospirota bacterium]MDE3043165.1 hypothetical protein [Nitrospirota bacterium]
MGSLPFRFGDNLKRRHADLEPVLLRAFALLLNAPGIALLGLVPCHDAAVQRPEEHAAHGRRAPGDLTALAISWGRLTLIVQLLRDRHHPFAGSAEAEDLPDHVRLLLVDFPFHVIALGPPVGIEHGRDDLDVVVAIAPAAAHMP